MRIASAANSPVQTPPDSAASASGIRIRGTGRLSAAGALSAATSSNRAMDRDKDRDAPAPAGPSTKAGGDLQSAFFIIRGQRADDAGRLGPQEPAKEPAQRESKRSRTDRDREDDEERGGGRRDRNRRNRR